MSKHQLHSDRIDEKPESTPGTSQTPSRLPAQRHIAALMALLLLPLLAVTAAAQPSPMPTGTPALASTASANPLQAALEAARAFTGGSADWQALYPDGVIHTFEDGVPMVLVPAGCFMMGSADGDDDEQPVHEQCLAEPFWIDLTEVTQGDFARLGGVKAYENGFEGEQRPVERINWFEARDFCTLRGARLPTEAEWEYAARGPEALVYPWGDAWDETLAVWNRTSSQGTANVGEIPAGASWVGALDLSGSVWEWVSTIYGVDTTRDYNFTDDNASIYRYPYAADDGREADSDDTRVARVLRGGSWLGDGPGRLRAASREGFNPDDRNVTFGFRCARSA